MYIYKKKIYIYIFFPFYVCSSITPKCFNQSRWFFLFLVGHVLPLVQLQNLFAFVFCELFFFFFLQVQFLCMPIDYSGLDWAIRMKPFAFSRGNLQISPVCRISPIYSLLIIVIAKNLLFTNFIYLCSVILVQLLNWYQDDSKPAAWPSALKLRFSI